MSVFIITGKLGSGKTLVSVGLIRDALNQGRKIATNIDLWPEEMLNWSNKTAEIYRLPDQLSAQAFNDIGSGNDTVEVVRGRNIYDEKLNGLIVLDEGGLSMNSRDFREEGRKEFIKWCIHSRKRGWDIAIIIQSFESLDKQIRDMFGEMIVYCMRFDKIKIPILGSLLNMIGLGGTMLHLHMAVCRYGSRADSPMTWRKIFKGKDLWFAFDTRQQYFPDDSEAVYQMLPPYYVKGRYKTRTQANLSLLRDIYEEYLGIKTSPLFVFFSALILGMWVHSKVFGVDEIGQPELEKRPAYNSSTLPEFGAAAGEEVFDLMELTPEGPKVDPWEQAYISTFMQLGGELTYRFKDVDGQQLHLPLGASLLAYNRCHVLVKDEETEFHVRCKRRMLVE
jgi:hypothetical protein